MQSMHFVQFVREYLRIFKYNGSCSLLDGLQPLGLPVEDDVNSSNLWAARCNTWVTFGRCDTTYELIAIYSPPSLLGHTDRHALTQWRPLRTLDPDKLSSRENFPRDISGIYDISYTVHTRNTYLQGVAIRYTTQNRRYIPFPENTCGFLYYQKPMPGNPDFSGSLRFRVVSEAGPKAFEDGVDLKLPGGGTWQIHLYSATRTIRHAGLVLKLLEEGLITPSITEKLRAMPNILLQCESQILYHLEDPFVTRLHTPESLVFMSDKGVESGQIMPVFYDPRKDICVHPYRGTVRACFERSTLPEHADTRTIVLRILEILSPVSCVVYGYDSYISLPTSGDLLSRQYGKKGDSHIRPWSTNLDRGKGKQARMFSLLWPKKGPNATT